MSLVCISLKGKRRMKMNKEEINSHGLSFWLLSLTLKTELLHSIRGPFFGLASFSTRHLLSLDIHMPISANPPPGNVLPDVFSKSTSSAQRYKYRPNLLFQNSHIPKQKVMMLLKKTRDRFLTKIFPPLLVHHCRHHSLRTNAEDLVFFLLLSWQASPTPQMRTFPCSFIGSLNPLSASHQHQCPRWFYFCCLLVEKGVFFLSFFQPPVYY